MINWKEALAKLLLVSLIVATVVGGTNSGNVAMAETKLKVLNAGSLMIPFTEIAEKFEREHPDVDVQIEGHGSIQVMRHVTEIGDRVDVTAVADYSLIPLLMYQTNMEGTEQPYADWYIKFATNNLGLAYTESSDYREEINRDNWYEIILREDVNYGISEPRFDACGYRALITTRMAEDYYGEDELFERMIGDSFKRFKIKSLEVAGKKKILVPQILQPRPRQVTLRGSSINLLAPLEAGGVDYAFQYESVARQHELGFLGLPPEINLGSSTFEESYSEVEVELDYQRFSSVNPVFRGRRITYGITIPKNAPNPKLAREFVKFIITEPGKEVLESNYHPTLETPKVDNPENLPELLRKINLEIED